MRQITSLLLAGVVGAAVLFLCLKLDAVGMFTRNESPPTFWTGMVILGLGTVLSFAAVLWLALTSR